MSAMLQHHRRFSSKYGGFRTFSDYCASMTLIGNEHFPDLGEWSEPELASLGYTKHCVSVFNHWLTAGEWQACPVTDRQKAERMGALPQFLAQEKAFIDFYKQLFKNGVFRQTGRRQAYGEAPIVWHSGWDRRLKMAVKNMVADIGWHGFYVPEYRLRIVGHHDRTDVLFFECEAFGAPVSDLARKHGLFLI